MIKNFLPERLFRQSIFLILATIVYAMSSCSMDDGDDAYMSELGASGSDYVVPETAGSIDIEVLTNLDYRLSFGQEVDWASFKSSEMSGDGAFTVDYKDNPGFKRMVPIYIESKNHSRSDTVYLKQKGAIEPTIAFKKSSTTVLGDGGRVEGEVDINIDFADVDVKITYANPNDGEWIDENFTIENGLFICNASPNLSETSLRNAKIELSFVNGWNEKMTSVLYLTQANALNQFGTKVPFTEVRGLAGGKVVDDIYIEGYVVSNFDSYNVAECPNTTTTAIDYSLNDKTAYIQSADGRYGFRVVTKTVDDNIFTRYSKVQLLLKGTDVVLDTDPNRYSITGVTSAMVMSSEAGTSSNIVVKEKYLRELTDDDIYTYVTLKDCEFPVRKGPLTPINEGYAIDFSANRISKYPLLVRDINGDSFFMMTNTKCPYRRDGSMLPYGSGKLSGVIVHETFTRFEYDDTSSEETYGNIGRYQIRHMSKEDIAFAEDISSSFSALLTEFRYYNLDNAVLAATNGTNGKMRWTNDMTVGPTSDYTYLGPIGKTNLGNKNGNGVIKDDGSKLSTNASTNSDGKGAVVAADNSAWSANCQWWNDAKNEGEGWILEFSTKGISTDQLSLQLSMMNWTIDGPRYWRIDWSEDVTNPQGWTLVEKFTSIDAAVWANTTLFQLPGYKNMNFKLPLDMLGKDKVYMRIVVDQNLCSDGQFYANRPITKASSVGMNYLAIRYNK